MIDHKRQPGKTFQPFLVAREIYDVLEAQARVIDARFDAECDRAIARDEERDELRAKLP